MQEDTDAFECSNRSFDTDVDEGAYTADESGISVDIEDHQYHVTMDPKGDTSMTTNFRSNGEFDGVIYEADKTIVQTTAEPAVIK